MRLPLLSIGLATSLACGGLPGGAPEPQPAATPAVVTPTDGATAPDAAARSAAPTAMRASSKPPVDPGDPALADHWLVVLASKKDAAEAVSSLATIAAHPEVPTRVRTLLSSRYKNLMPCYTVTIADATTDKKAALALSKQLKALNVDNYVKNTGAFVGPSAAIDAFCAPTDPTGGGAVAVLAQVGGDWWMRVDAPEAVVANLLPGRPAALDASYDAWHEPVAATSVGAVAIGGKYRAVDAATGRTASCTVVELAGLTLGTPHFGVLQAETPPKAPPCGSEAIYARLDCGGVADGAWVVAPEGGAALVPYAPLGEAKTLLPAADRVLGEQRDYNEAAQGVEGSEAVTIGRSVTRWKGPVGEVYVVAGSVAIGDGICGGQEDNWYGLFSASGEGLGGALAPIQRDTFTTLVGLIDVEGDGIPELVTTSFPQTMTVTGKGGVLAGRTIDFCDCPC